jgi:hypothetical protein
MGVAGVAAPQKRSRLRARRFIARAGHQCFWLIVLWGEIKIS